MAHYQVLARKYRPQTFAEVIGQDAVVRTLKNAIRMGRLAHAYLFCGSRGTGKTTLARVFAKALNCQAPIDGEPCCACSSCKEITSGNSLDVLEIDGASHRGIDDIRQINETVGYASSSGKYKIYIIDEVHMLTKEAFNALLKTLEEPPAKVVFVFATTEPHKVLPTILSRCQRFNLGRIALEQITTKLRRIASDLNLQVDDDAIGLLARRAEGGLRDAESLFDQIIAFHEGRITVDTVNDVLGIVPKDLLFAMDRAGKEGRLSFAFEIAGRIFSEGKDIGQFIESMVEHFRSLLLVKMAGTESSFLSLLEADKARYQESAALYNQEQCLSILDFLVESQGNSRFQSSGRIALESVLLHVMRIHQRLPIGLLVRKLSELEQRVMGSATAPQSPPIPPRQDEPTHHSMAINAPIVTVKAPINEVKEAPAVKLVEAKPVATVPAVDPLSALERVMAAAAKPSVQHDACVTEDPVPTPEELGIKKKAPAVQAAKKQEEPKADGVAAAEQSKHPDSYYDTILQFAAVELEGTVQKK